MANDSADTSSSPLPLLRKLAIAGRAGEIAFSGDFVVFPDGGPKLKGDSPTALHNARKNEAYSLKSVVFAVQTAAEKVGEYLKQSRKLKIGDPVSVITQEVVQYFLGKSDKCSILRKAEATQARKEPAVGANKRARTTPEGKQAKDAALKKAARKKQRVVKLGPLEESYSNRNTVLLSARSLKEVLSISIRAKQKLLDVSRKRAAGQMVAGDRDFKPIIIVPAGLKALITLRNAKFLAEGFLDVTSKTMARGKWPCSESFQVECATTESFPMFES